MRYIASPEYNLVTERPLVASQWHPVKNGKLKPTDVTPSSHKRAWWKCKKGHEWKSRIFSRAYGDSCPICNGQGAYRDNTLSIVNPELSKQWHPTKNRSLLPSQVTCGSSKKVWWACENGHEWRAVVGQRSSARRSNCPFCKKFFSKIEMRIFTELDTLIGSIWHDQSFGVEVDVYIPKLKVAIEVDGSHWHKGKRQKDIAKNELLTVRGITVVRVRELPLKIISKNDVLCTHREDQFAVTRRLVQKLSYITGKDFKSYLHRKDFLDPDKYNNLVSKMCFPSESVAAIAPHLVKEWHPTKNGSITPDNISYASHKPIWWVCSKGHEWKTFPSNRTRKDTGGTGCPKCALLNRSLVDDETFLMYISSGMTFKEVADKIGTSRGCVQNKVGLMRKNGINIPRRQSGSKPKEKHEPKS